MGYYIVSSSNDYLICCNEYQANILTPSFGSSTVQLMSKFTTRVVFSRVLFEALIKTRVTHVSEQIVCEGLVHTSIDRVWSLHVSLYEKYKSSYIHNKSSLGCTRVDA